MSTPGHGQVSTASELASKLAALKGKAPEPTRYAVYHAWSGDSVGPPGYLLPGGAVSLDAPSFEAWLADQGLVGTDRLGLAVLVVRGQLDPAGDIESCTLEYRRGAADGPHHGNPAVISFTGPVQTVRFHQALPDGQLREIAPAPGLLDRSDAAHLRSAGQDATVPIALQACFGGTVQVTGTRNPTVIEAMAGITRVLHVAVPGGRETGCGMLWHGPIAVALPAAFPRFDVAPRLGPRQRAALSAALTAEGLVACATRQEARSVAMLARRPDSTDLFLVRLDRDRPRITPHVPARPAGLADAQAQWLDYVETYERLRVLDATRDDTSGALLAVTLGPDSLVWRHNVDEDGVELWRTPATEETDMPVPAAPVADPAAVIPETQLEPACPAIAEAPFGDVVDARFPGAAYDIDEAARCLRTGRSTAAVFHALRVIEHGIRGYAAWRGAPDPIAGVSVPRWRLLLRWVRNDPESDDIYATVDGMRTAWRSAALQVGPKYTEAEAMHIVAAVEQFIRRLAAVCDEDGVPAAELDDEM